MGFGTIKRFILVLFFCLFPTLGWGYTETFYATATGAGTKAGTSLANAFSLTELEDSSNWADGTDASDGKVGANDVVYFYDDHGNFSGRFDTPRGYDGLSGLPITLMNGSGETPVISGGEHAIDIEGSYITLDGFTLQSTTNNVIWVNSDNVPANYVTIQNCILQNGSASGLYAGGTNGVTNLTVRCNTIQNNGTLHDNHHGMYLSNVDSSTIEENYVLGNASWGIHLRGGCDNNIVRYNFVMNNCQGGTDGGGIDVKTHITTPSTNNDVYYNIMIGNYRGIRIGDGDADGPTGNKIYNNTIYDSENQGITIDGMTTDVGDVYNNIIWGTDNGQKVLDLYYVDNTVFDSDYNTIGPEGTSFIRYDGSNYNTLAAYQSASSEDGNSIKDDPLFTDAPNDLSLTSSSPAKNVGTDLTASYDDGLDPASTWPSSVSTLDQDLYGSSWEMGAYVYNVATTATLTGTIVAGGVTEVEIVAGGETLIITLSEDTWVATIGDDNGFTDGLIAGIDSGGAETHGWDVEVKGNMVHGDVARTNDTTVTITLGAEASYAITSNETITVTIPADNLVESDSAVVATPTFEITATSDPAAALTGTLSDNATEAQVVTGGETLIITLTNDTWVAAGATFDGIRQDIIDGMDSAQAEGTGWNAEVRDKEVVTAVVRTNDTVVTITLTAAAAYDISANESITMTVPASALVTSGSPVVATPAFAIIFFDTSTEEIVGMTLQ